MTERLIIISVLPIGKSGMHKEAIESYKAGDKD